MSLNKYEIKNVIDINKSNNLVTLVNKSYEDSWFFKKPEGYIRVTNDEIKSYILDQKNYLILALNDISFPQDIIACILLKFYSNRSGSFGLFSVHPFHQKKGIGTLLLNAVEKTFLEYDIIRIYIEVVHLQDHLIRYYIKFGYKIIKEIKWEEIASLSILNQPAHFIQMSKHLKNYYRYFKFIIKYDGKDFHGFQLQNNLRTVQGVIEDSIYRFCNEFVRIKGSSRTDKGVHAMGQVITVKINYKSITNLSLSSIISSINNRLPDDVAIQSGEELNYDDENTIIIDPRKHCKEKIYQYDISYSNIRPVLMRNRVWYITPYFNNKLVMNEKTSTDLEFSKFIFFDNIKRAIKHIISAPHDYSAFTPKKKCKKPKKDVSNKESNDNNDDKICCENICFITSIDIHIDEMNQTARFLFTGNRFLYKMVRNLVGVLIDIGLNKLQPDDIISILSNQNKEYVRKGAPAHALTLLKVLY